MKNDERILELPQPIIDRLQEVIRRIRRLQWIKGSLLTLSAAVGSVLVLMLLDATFLLESLPLRLVLSVAALAATLGVAWNCWLRPLCRRISLTAVARWVESRHPELQERISTAVELLGDRHSSDQGSRELLDAVVKDAVADAGRLDPSQHLSPRRTRPAKWLAGTVVAALVAITAIWPGKIPLLLVRAVAPLADWGNAQADRLRVLTPSQVVALGDPLEIQVALRGRAERVELHLTDLEGSPVVEMLQPDAAVPVEPGESGYSLRTPSVQQSFTARIVAGKSISAAFTITALPRPESGDWTLTYHFPDYTGRPDEVKTGASGAISALIGTKLTARTKLTRPAARASVKIGEVNLPDVLLNPGPAAPDVTWSTVLTPDLDALWSLHLEDENGIVNQPVKRPIRAVPDLPPLLSLETPVENRLELRPTERLPLTYFVKEDIGLSTVQIRVRPQQGAEILLPAAGLPDKSPGTMDEYRGTAVLDLAKVPVPDGQEIRVSLMAADLVPTEMQGPQRGWSREITIRLNRWTRPLVEKNFEDQHHELRQKMEEVKRELYSARGRMNDKPDRLKQEERLSENTLKDIEASSGHLQMAETLLQALAQRMKETAYARQTPAMDEISQQMVQPAKASAKEIPLTDQKEVRAGLAKQTKDLLENAIKQMDQQSQQMEQSRQAVQQAAKLSDIAEQQQWLAATAAQAGAGPLSASALAEGPERRTEQNSSTDPARPEGAVPAPTDAEQRQWLEEQRRVAQRAKELMEQNARSNPQATQEQMKQAAGQATQLAAEAESLSQQESALARTMVTSSTPEAIQQTISDQQFVAQRAAALLEKAKGFQQQSNPQINQSTETQSAAFEAQTQLEEASSQAGAAAAAMTAASPEKPGLPGSGASSNPNTGDPAPADASVGPRDGAPAAITPDKPIDSMTAAAIPRPDDAKLPASPATAVKPTLTPAARGQQAALASSASLTKAAASLKSLGAAMNALAGILADHSNSLGAGAQQAGAAVDQAAKPQNEQGKSPSMQQGAAAAQQAADQLGLAANTLMQAMSIPASAKSSQTSAPSKGQEKPANGQPQPPQPGPEGKDGIQLDTASSALPAELAKLGLTPDDWMKLKSTLNGVNGASNDQIPAEYRELIKAYFGTLAKGYPAK